MKTMKDLFLSLTFSGYATSRADAEYGNGFTVWDDNKCISVAFNPRNNCSNRGVDFGWACEDAEVMIWNRHPPYAALVGPDSGVWNNRNASQVLDLVLEHLALPSSLS